MNILEPCCYTKQFNRFLYDTKLDVIPVYHSGDIYSSHILERVGILAPKHSTLWVVMPTINEYTLRYIQSTMKRVCMNMETKTQMPKFNVVNILTSEMPSDHSLLALDGQQLNIVIKKNIGFSMIGSTTPNPQTGQSHNPQTAQSNNPLTAQSPKPLTAQSPNPPTAKSPNPPIDNFRVGECLLVTGSIIQTQVPGLHVIEIHRGPEQLEYLIPFVRSRFRISNKSNHLNG